MKRGTPGHLKTRELAHAIGRPLPHAAGILEFLWHYTAQYTPAGDVGRYSDATIEEICCWDGEPGQLVAALTACRWLDPHPKHRLIVHDWPQHADEAVHKALGRACKLFATGEEPKLGGLDPKEKARALEAYALIRETGAPAATAGEPPAAAGDLPATGGDRRSPAVAVAVATITDPPLPPRFAGGDVGPPAAAGGRNGTEAAQVEELTEYAIRLGCRPNRQERRRYRDALRAGHSVAELKGSIAERRRELLVSAGQLDPMAEWPPPGLSPFPEARASPADEADGQEGSAGGCEGPSWKERSTA